MSEVFEWYGKDIYDMIYNYYGNNTWFMNVDGLYQGSLIIIIIDIYLRFKSVILDSIIENKFLSRTCFYTFNLGYNIIFISSYHHTKSDSNLNYLRINLHKFLLLIVFFYHYIHSKQKK